MEEYLSVHLKTQRGAIPQMKLFSISIGSFAEISQTGVCWRRLLFIILKLNVSFSFPAALFINFDVKFWYNISSVHTNSNKLAPKSRVLHPSQGHRERGLCVLRTSVKSITLRLICGFHIFFIISFDKAGEFCFKSWKKSNFLEGSLDFLPMFSYGFYLI